MGLFGKKKVEVHTFANVAEASESLVEASKLGDLTAVRLALEAGASLDECEIGTLVRCPPLPPFPRRACVLPRRSTLERALMLARALYGAAELAAALCRT